MQPLTANNVDDLEVAPPYLFLPEMLVRNAGVLSDREQALVSSARVLVAGCGSVGAAIVDPLTRMGIGELVLADPDAYDVTNLNRQAAWLADVGANKAEVQAARARAINPYVGVRSHPEGITEENVAEVVTGASVVYDAVDIAEGGLLWKFLLHKEAARQGIPVVSGIDTSGKAWVYLFDYGRDPRPFYGKCTEEAFRRATEAGPGSGESVRAIAGWVRFATMPADFLEMGRTVIATGSSWPQVSYAVAGLGAVASRVVVDVLANRPVRRVTSVDFHDVPRGPRRRAAARMRWFGEVYRTARFLRAPRRRPAPVPPAALPAGWPGQLVAVAEAVRHAPSARNAQPWRLSHEGEDRIRLRVDPAIRPPGDSGGPLGRLPGDAELHQSLGCAIESAAAVADISCERLPGAAGRAGRLPGAELRVEGIRRDVYLRNCGLLRIRATDRHPFAEAAPAPALLARLTAAAAAHDVGTAVIDDRSRRQQLAREVRDQTAATRDLGRMEELLDWSRAGAGPKLARRLPEWIALPAMARSRRSDRLLRRSGALILLEGGGAGWSGVRLGRALMALWLEATRAGLAVHPMAELLQEPAVSAAVGSAFGLGSDESPGILVRVGHGLGTATPPSRLPLAAICEPVTT